MIPVAPREINGIQLAPNREIRVFGPKTELAVLGLSTFGLILCSVFAVLGIGPWGPHGMDWLLFLSGSLFLNTTHTAFTYHILFFFPEAQSWFNGQSEKEKWLLWTRWSLIFLGICIFWGFLLFRTQDTDELGIAPWVKALLQFFPFHHGVKQIAGISVIYNQKLKQTVENDEVLLDKIKVCEKREKAFFFLFLVCLSTTLFTNIILPGNVWLNRALPTLGSLFILAILGNSLKFPNVHKSNKTYFLTRLLFYPLSNFTFFATFFIAATHGTEYLAIYLKMYKNSKVTGVQSLRWILILTAFVVFLFLVSPFQGLNWLIAPYFASQIWIINGMATLSISIIFMHYFLDRQLYRMSDPLVKDNIGPLLIRDQTS
jgi:hypothetical protein